MAETFPLIPKRKESTEGVQVTEPSSGTEILTNLEVTDGLIIPVGDDAAPIGALPSSEDFLAEYTALDGGSDLTVAASRITWTNLNRNVETYVSKDYKTGFFDDDFVVKFSFRFSLTDDNSQMALWAMSNILEDARALQFDPKYDSLGILYVEQTAPDLNILSLRETSSGTTYSDGSAGYAFDDNTTYYVKVIRDMSTGTYGTLTMNIYSDSLFKTHASGANPQQIITLHDSKKKFRYNMAVLSWNSGSAIVSSGQIDDMQLGTPDAAGGIWIKSGTIQIIDEDGIRQTLVTEESVDDAPVDGASNDPISSNWAFDHVAAADPHTGYMLESNIGIGDDNYLEIDDADTADDDYAKFTANGLEGRDYSEVLSDLSGAAASAFSWNGQNLTSTGTVTASTSVWHHEHDLFATSLNPGASGATRTAPDSNTIGGWQLNAAGETLYFEAHMEVEWDAVSDLIINVWWEVNVDNTGGAGGDTVDLQLVVRYKGEGETTIKTQTVEVATTVGASARYKQFKTTFTIDYDAANNVIDSLDVLSFALNLETDTGEVDDIILNLVELRYATTKPSLEA